MGPTLLELIRLPLADSLNIWDYLQVEIIKYKQFQRWSKELDGVFTGKDLEVAFNKSSRSALYRDLNTLISQGDLVRIKRGIYATKEAKLSTIASRIYPESYISTGTVLAQKAIIGTLPAKKIQAVKKGLPRTFKTSLGTIEFLSISPRLYFGFERKDNVNWATPEKAFLDVCYFYYKRKKFSFDPTSDVNATLLNLKLVNQFLNNYDIGFVTFFKKRWLDHE